MTKPEGPTPPLPERVRIPLRIASVVIGYVIYRIVGEPVGAALLVWIGFVMLDWAIIEKATTFRKDRLSMMLVGQGFLGAGLLAAGAIMATQ
ncbi:MAG: hypothetical protein KY391_02370 [Actinobacteria bacterium]|nr:hypothetical protein [Actinomycetota bacterium]